MAKAEVEDRPVEVSELTTETERVIADPESGSFQAEISPLPVRVQNGDEWVDLDSTLSVGPDGVVAPVAALAHITIDHGTDPFVTVGDSGYSMGLRWQSALPAPELHGDVAVWPNVAPGIDLAVESGASGVRQFFVVRTAAAAADPLLADLRLGYVAPGLSLTAKDGGFEARTVQGELAFASPQLRMWEAPVSMTGTPGEVAAAAISSTEGQGARSAAVGLTVTSTDLLLAPDQAMLNDPTTRFPVVIDPTVERKRVVWGMVWSDGQEFWDHSTENARVGYDGWEGNKKSRVFYRFDAAAFAGTKISSATLTHKQVHSTRGCDVTAGVPGVELWYTGGISSSLTWSNQPEWRQRLDTSMTAHGHRDSGCGAYSLTEWSATTGAQIVADEGWSTFTVGIKSADEGDKYGWRQFDNDASYPVLSVTYNRTPNVPSAVTITPLVDYKGAKFMNMTTPTMKVAVSDPDGGSVRARYIVNPIPDGAVDDRKLYYSGYVTSGQQPIFTVPAGVLVNGSVYDLYARANDGALESVSGPATRITIDTVAPNKPTVTPPASNPAVGTTASLKFTSTSTDTAQFVYGVNTDTPSVAVEPAALGGVATATFTVDKFGPNWVTVYAVDRAGNRSAMARGEFKVDGTLPYRRYQLDGNGNDTRVGTSQPTFSPSNLTVPAGASPWVDGRYYSWPTEPDGTPGGVRTACDRALTVSPSVTVKSLTTATDPANTRGQFSISAWVRPTELVTVNTGTGYEAMAVSTYTGDSSSIAIGYRKASATGTPTWFLAYDDDAVYGNRGFVATTLPVTVNEWTHLTTVWNPAAKKISLYVNGTLAAEQATTNHVFDASYLMVGAAPSGGYGNVGWKGSIDEVLLYAGVLDPVQVSNAHLYARDPGTC